MKRTIIILLGFLAPSLVFAQTPWLQRTDESSLALEYVGPNFKAEASFFKISGFTFLVSGRIALGDDNFLIVEVPYAQTTVEVSFFGPTQKETKAGIANPYLGLEFGSSDKSNYVTVGCHLPLLKEDIDDAVFVPILGDYVHLGRYIPDYLPLQASFNYQPRMESGLAFLLGIGPSVWFPLRGSGGDVELIAEYRGGVGFMHEVVTLGATMTGQWFTTGNEPTASESFRHHVQVEVNARIGSAMPGLYLRIPLGSSLSDIVNNTIGARIAVVL